MGRILAASDATGVSATLLAGQPHDMMRATGPARPCCALSARRSSSALSGGVTALPQRPAARRARGVARLPRASSGADAAPPAPEQGAPAASNDVQRPSAWTDKFFGQKEGEDYLYELGKKSASMRIDMGAKTGLIDSLFTGKFMGQQADIANGELRTYERRTFANLVRAPPAACSARRCSALTPPPRRRSETTTCRLASWRPWRCTW